MIAKLKEFFPSLQHFDTIPTTLDDQYKWFITNTNEIIGIHQDELEAKDLLLLNTFLEQLQPLFPIMSADEKKWKSWVQQETIQSGSDFTFRFIYFEIAREQLDPIAFKDAINQLFAKDITILWENEQTGIIIEQQPSDLEEPISYSEIIDILMSDLYVKIRFFIGPYLSSQTNMKQHYHHLTSSAQIAFAHSESNVITYLEAIPYLLIDQADPAFKQDISSLVLQEFLHDSDFSNMMEVFLESNLNISVAAKKLYMHRNSLQYRIDKFYERTGIDVRDFYQALTVYLALLAK
ncbi:PucR family transcriptional regulator [Ornithinibacillus contaminans]|uniref:PucR family transcriptional regulator n=1 Tax=Ornithinibacillus contaminans TaxID=694055 RepID=UPI00064E0FA4|nr:PucR family transcriptional regulator [Ornithinibacillus contaminans]